MAKIVPLESRAFGAEPGIPDIGALTHWVADHRGTSADLHSYQLDQSLAPQLLANITKPCAGGLFCRDRIRASLIGIHGDTLTDEIDTDTGSLREDAERVSSQKKGTWCAIPAPHELGISDGYYHDDDEWNEALCGTYRTIMRAMRDGGAGGHVIICSEINETEISLLARDKVFFFETAPDRENLSILMEYQDRVAVGNKMLETIFDLSNEYHLQQLIVMDPEKEAIRFALSHLDPDQVMAGGYCTESCDTYWEKLAESAVYQK